MFARMRFVCAFLAASAVVFHAGCQTPGGPQPNGVKPVQTPAGAKDKTAGETPADLPPAKIEAQTYLAAARLHESQHRPLPALEQYQHALAEDPKNVHILVRMGYLYDTVGNSAMAEKMYLEALRIEPNNAQVHNNLAFSYILRQRWQDAQVALTRAIELAPEFARARINLGMVLAQTGHFDDALRQFQMVLPPEEAYYNLGLMYQSKRKMVEAAEAYKRALQANPKLVAAGEQLKKMPADVLGAADRKMQEAAEAAASLAANSPEPVTEPTSASHPAPDEALTETLEPSSWFDDYINGMLVDFEDWVPDTTLIALADAPAPATQPAEVSIDGGLDFDVESAPVIFPAALTGFAGELPSTQPAAAVDAPTPRLVSLDAFLASQLDDLLPVWQRSPELMRDLTVDPSVLMLGADTSEWLDLEGSPAATSAAEPEATQASRSIAHTTQPE